MDKDIAVTPEEYSEVLCTWLRMHTEETAVKTMAKYVGYKMSLFDSDRKLKFLEELIFVYAALSCYVSQSVLAGNDSYGSIRDSFVQKVAQRYGKDLSADDPDFKIHYSEKLKEYSSAVSEDERQPEVSRIFIASLPPKGVRKPLKSAALAAVSFGIFCSTLKETLAKHRVVPAPD
jgi:hypothetical protein